MKPSPCLHPVRVYNKTLRTWLYQPCGHCDACIAGRGFRLSERLGETIARYSSKYFITLTFSDAYLPVARYDAVTDFYMHPLDCDYNGVCYSCDRLLVDKSCESSKEFNASFVKYNGVQVLSRRLAILFKKRLRKHFAKIYGKEYLFIYIVGEYGPSTFRPHYHAVLCTNAKCTSSVLEECVHKAWSDYDKASQSFVSEYGRIDFQRIVSNGVRNYVAQYLNCTTNLPCCLSLSSFRPFYQSGPLIDTDVCQYAASDLSKIFFACNPEAVGFSCMDNKEFCSVLPQGIINRVFPKCFKFGVLSGCDRDRFYSVYSEVSKFTASEFADLILSAYVNDCSVFALCRSLLVDCDVFTSRQRLIRHYYLSRRVCRNALKFGVSVSDYVRQIDLFWSRYELLKLKNFYEMQVALLEDVMNPCTLRQLFSLYYNTDEGLKNLDVYLEQFGFPAPSDTVASIPSQSGYSCLMHKIILDSTKTKKRNGYFDKNGYLRPSFISKFKSKNYGSFLKFKTAKFS